MPAGISSRRGPGGHAPLAHEEQPVVLVEREHRDRARVPDDVARSPRAVGALDRVDAELHVPPAVDDLGRDDALLERVGPGFRGPGPRRRLVVYAATASSVLTSDAPLSGSNM